MAIYAISDLHLGFSVNKPMDIFGGRWMGYTGILKEYWNRMVTSDDLVLLPGDTSWATYLEDAVEDFKFIDNLPGRKVITKGNHDYWWETITKMNSFLTLNSISTIEFLHNSVIMYNGIAICGTKGYPDNITKSEDEKLFNRELSRLQLSLEAAKKQKADKIVVMLHYPPDVNSEFAKIMTEYSANVCIYGHLHDKSVHNAVQGIYGGVLYRLVSCDYLKFMPINIQI